MLEDKEAGESRDKDEIMKKSVRITSISRDPAESQERLSPYSITDEELEKRIRSQNTGRKITQIYSCLVVSMGHLSFGTSLGWASSMIYRHIATEKEQGLEGQIDYDFGNYFTWMTSMVPLGACLGSGVWTMMGYNKGPRKTLLILTQAYIILSVCVFFVTSRGFLQASRFFMGFFGVAYLVCGQMLLNDTIHILLLRHMRIVPSVSVLIGVFLVQMTGVFAESHNGGLACIAISVVTCIMLFIMPESPVYMYKKGEKHAEDSLSWYLGRNNISDPMRRIRKDYEYRRMNAEDKFMLNSTVVRKAVLIVIGIVVLQVGSGYHLFLFYGTVIWSMVPLISQKADVVVLGVLLIGSKLFWALVHLKMKFPVRLPLILSCIIVATAQLVLAAILFFLSFQICVSSDYLRWCSFLCCFFIIFGFEFGLNHYPSILTYMYLPSQVFQTGMAIIHLVFWLLVAFIIKFHGLLHTRYSSWGVFLGASIFLYVGALYIYFFVVEVKGRSLIQIQLDIGGNPVGTRASMGMRTGPEDF